MKVSIKDFSVNMEIKAKGVELAVYSPDKTTHYGDLIVTMTGLTWCKGATHAAGGKKVKWIDFINWIENI